MSRTSSSRRRARARIPVVQQASAADCGAACLAMVLGHLGRRTRLEEVRKVLGGGRDGVDAQEILEAATAMGLRGRGIHLELEDLAYLKAGSILHWRFQHFVVFERLRKDGVEIIDPSCGRRLVTRQQFGKSFTGVALVFEPTERLDAGHPGEGLWAYLPHLLRQRQLLSRILLTSVLIQMFAMATPLMTGALVDRVVPRRDYHLLVVLLAGLLGMVFFGALASLVRSYLLLQLRTHMDARMTLGFLDHLVDLPYAFFQERTAGDLMMRLGSQAVVREILTSTALSGMLDGVLVGLYLILLFVTSPPIATLVVVLAGLRVSLYILSRKRYRELMNESLQSQAELQGYQVQMFAGMETLKASGVEHRAATYWSNLFVKTLNVSIERGKLGIRVETLMGTLGMASPLILLGYGGAQVLDGTMSLGMMLATSALAAGFLGPLTSLVSTALRIQEVGSYLERLDDVMKNPPEQDKDSVAFAGRLSGTVILDRVSFRYTPHRARVVEDVSVEIRPGQFVAIVGTSGGGKSTLGRLLLGLYRPESGRILFDGVDLAELELRSVRRQVGIVPQHTHLFPGTIRENIALAEPTLTLDDVTAAAKLAHIHDDILMMPLGYDTPLTDGGASLSAGQRQRIALARALVQRPVILLLDEATSALDAVTESNVQRSIASLGCARIVIAHRLSTIVHADRILVMEQGRIVERGRHAELMALQGRYAALVEAQVEPEAKPRFSTAAPA